MQESIVLNITELCELKKLHQQKDALCKFSTIALNCNRHSNLSAWATSMSTVLLTKIQQWWEIVQRKYNICTQNYTSWSVNFDEGCLYLVNSVEPLPSTIQNEKVIGIISEGERNEIMYLLGDQATIEEIILSLSEHNSNETELFKKLLERYVNTCEKTIFWWATVSKKYGWQYQYNQKWGINTVTREVILSE